MKNIAIILIATFVKCVAQSGTPCSPTQLEILTERVRVFMSSQYHDCSPIGLVMQSNVVEYSEDIFNGILISDIKPIKDRKVVIGVFKFQFDTKGGPVNPAQTRFVNDYPFKIIVKPVLGDYIIQELYCPYSIYGWNKVYPKD